MRQAILALTAGVGLALSLALGAGGEGNTYAGVPRVDPDYSQSVESWWAQHPLNPDSPNYTQNFESPSPVVDVQRVYGEDLQAAIDALPAEGGTLYLRRGVYQRFTMVGRSNVHFIGADRATTLLRGGEIWGCAQAVDYNAFLRALLRDHDPAAVACFQSPPRNIYFRNLSFDGAGRQVTHPSSSYADGVAVFLGSIRDVLFDNVTFQNYTDASAEWHPGLVSGNRGIANVWCRGCLFRGPFRWAWFLDGARGSGVVGSRVEGRFQSGAFLWLANDDFTGDIDGDGKVDFPEEYRNARYNVMANNSFANGGHDQIVISGWSNLVLGNTAEALTGRFVDITARCSRLYQQDVVYRHYDNVIARNYVADTYTFVELEGNAGLGCASASTNPDAAARNYGRIGRAILRDNVIGGTHLEALLKEDAPIELPSITQNNTRIAPRN